MTGSGARSFLDGRVTLHAGDCLAVLPTLDENSIDSCVTDPPYHLASIVKRFSDANGEKEKFANNNPSKQFGALSRGFMGKAWDGGDVAFRPETWAAVLRVLKPGGHLVAFAAPKNAHRMVCAIEDGGFEIRDTIAWLFGSGFPKSHDVSKGIDRAAPSITAPATDSARQWQGWGTALKPAYEPIVLARKPLIGRVAENVLKHGVGAINIDACRVGHDEPEKHAQRTVGKFSGIAYAKDDYSIHMDGGSIASANAKGRWPANVIHDGSDEVVEAFPQSESGGVTHQPKRSGYSGFNVERDSGTHVQRDPDSGSAARFFYTSKADSDDRLGSKHPTVKPLDLMQYLVRLVTPPKGTILDPFAGTGTTAEAAWREGFNAVLIEREPEYLADIERRMSLCLAGPDQRARESIKARQAGKPQDHGPLFGEAVI